MSHQSKSALFISFVVGLLLIGSVSCTTQNPPVNAKTGATVTK